MAIIFGFYLAEFLIIGISVIYIYIITLYFEKLLNLFRFISIYIFFGNSTQDAPQLIGAKGRVIRWPIIG